MLSQLSLCVHNYDESLQKRSRSVNTVITIGGHDERRKTFIEQKNKEAKVLLFCYKKSETRNLIPD
jgi:hypothetical protein